MLTKNDFSPADWNSIRDVPHLIGIAMLITGSSGLGTVKESIAMAQGVLEGQSSHVPLIRDLSNRAEMQEAQTAVRSVLGDVDAKDAKEQLRRIALERVTAVMSLLQDKATPEEAAEFRRWLYGIAEKVAKSAREGGFLGFGGTQVSEDEQSFLTDLRSALQLQTV